MDPDKAKSRGISCDMSPASVEARLEAVDELRELAIALSSAQRLGPVEVQVNASNLPPSSPILQSKFAE